MLLRRIYLAFKCKAARIYHKWQYRSPRTVWEAWGEYYHTDSYCSSYFPQDDWLLDRITTLGPESLFEAGCGAGRLLSFLDRRIRSGANRVSLMGMDFSSSMLRHAKESVPAHIPVIQGDVTCLPMADGSFDWAYTHGCLMHLNTREKLNKALSELRRIVRAGVIILEETNAKPEISQEGHTPNGLAYYWDYIHALELNGFDVVDEARFRNLETVICCVARKK